MSSRSLVNRMLRATKLDVNLYEEVKADTTANRQAILAVTLVGLATGAGNGIPGMVVGSWFMFICGLLMGLIPSIVGWLAWSFLAYILGTKVFKGPQTSATWGELLRTIGFSNSPGVFRFFLFIPYVAGVVEWGVAWWILFVAVSVWVLIAGVIAVRQALDFSTGRAIASCIVGWVIYVLIVFLASLPFFIVLLGG